MTFHRGSDKPANLGGGSLAEPPFDLARLAADLEPRVARLDRFVQGLISVLQRFDDRARGENPAEIFGDFEAPEASHEALRVLSEASTSARHDLAVVRRDIRPLVRASQPGVEPAIVGRIRETGLSASALATRFEAFARSAQDFLADPTEAARRPSPAAVEGLRGFLAIADRALRDVAESAFIIQREDGHDEFRAVPGEATAATAATAATGSLAVFKPRRDWGRRRAGALLAAAAAGGAWPGRAFAALRESRGLLPLGAGGAIGGVILVAVIAANNLPPGPADGTSVPSGAVASGAASPASSDGGIAVGSASPGTSPGASPGPTPEPSLEPGQTPPPTPRPGASPGPSTPGSTPGPSFGASPGPSQPPTPTPPGATPTPPGATPPPPTPTPTPAPAPTPTPTLEPGAAADQFGLRVTAGANAADALLDQITIAVQDSDFIQAGNLAEDLETLAAAERAWLQAHPPAACYQTHHTNALARYADLIATADEIQAEADAENASAIHNDVASGNFDVAALKQAANKAMADCP